MTAFCINCQLEVYKSELNDKLLCEECSKCDDCGNVIKDEETWNSIRDYILCEECLKKRLRTKNINMVRIIVASVVISTIVLQLFLLLIGAL